MAHFVRNDLICAHPALSSRYRELWTSSNYADQELSHTFDFSYEMVAFLSRLNTGVDWQSDTARRCFKAASRKGCYKEPILHPMGFAAGTTGERAILDAKIIYARLLAWYRYHQTPLPPVDQTQTMDEIVVYGNISTYSLRMLQLVWTYAKPDEHATVPPVTYSWLLKTVDVDGETFALASSIRSNIHARTAVETLIKFGLVELSTLPKLPEQRGKGRAPVGFRITAAGQRFFSDYLSNFSEQGKFVRAVKDEQRVESPTVSETSDVVEGENLRDLFG